MTSIVEMGMQELLELAASKTWWVWTVGVCPWSQRPILSASNLLMGDTIREFLFTMPRLLCRDELRAELFVDELNRQGGWDIDTRLAQEQRLAVLRSALPSPTVAYCGRG